MDAPPRPLRLGPFAVSGDQLIVIDEAAPVAIEVDIESGEIRSAHTWKVPPFSGRPIAHAVEIVNGSIVIASPAAGGLVYIDRETSEITTIALDAPIGRLVVDGSTVWAIAHPDWNEHIDDERFGRRPIVWIDPTAEEVAEYRDQMQRQQVWTSEPGGDGKWFLRRDQPEPDVDWRAHSDSSDIIGPPTPVWRVDAGVAQRVDFGGELGDLVPLGDRMLAVCVLPTDPIIKRIHPGGGGLSNHSPASVLLGTPESGFEPVGTLPHFGIVWVADERVWLLGPDTTSTDRETLRRFDLADRTASDPLPLRADHPVAIVGATLVDAPWSAPRAQRVLRLVPLDGGPAISIPIPDVEIGWSEELTIVGHDIWLRERHETAVVGVDTDTGAVREVRLDIDCAPYLPLATPDPAASQSSITVPVMLDEGDLQCCQPDATVGAPWTASLLLGDAEPWWLEHATEPVPVDVHNLGVIEFDGTVLRSAADEWHAGLVETGPIRVAVTGVAAEQHHFRGVLDHAVHGADEGVLDYENACTGVVRRIQGIAYRREHKSWDGEPAFLPVAQDLPVDLESTTARGFDVYVLTIEFGPGATA